MTEIVDAPASSLPVLDDAGRRLMFTDARTAGSFAPTPVSDAELREIWELARWAPTAANLQPMRVLFVRTDEGRARLLPHLAEGNRAKTASAPAVAVLAADMHFHERIPEVFPIRPEMREPYDQDDALRELAASYNTSLQSAYFILAVRAVGLAAGPMAGFDAAGLDAELFPDGRLRTSLVVNIGHPGVDPWFPRLPRLAVDDVVAWA